MYAINETIVALATPPGAGAIGVIRLSGREAITIANKIFKGKNLATQRTHTLHFGRIMQDGEVLDEVVISLFHAPKSYTGENVVEISCHGSSYILEQVIRLCLQEGAVPAKPGEFTQRAYLNGRLDLTQAEAVADLIASQSSAAHHAAMHNLRGGFSKDLQQIRDELIRFSALIELELDFSEEDVEFADRTELHGLIEDANRQIQQLLDSFQLGNVITQGIKVAIVGRPNAGKSTLLNALLNEERAIVSEIAGTTRDTVEETLNIRGVIFRLIDTAGIREHSMDTIENIGMARSRKAMEAADIIIVLIAPEKTESVIESPTMAANDQAHRQTVAALDDALSITKQNKKAFLVVNKEDLLDDFERQTILKSEPEAIFITAKEQTGIDLIKERLFLRATSGLGAVEGTIVTNARHFAALQEVQKSLLDIVRGMHQNLSGDLLALDIRRCLHFLGEITGEITTEDKLDYIFSKFCIGK